MLVTSWITNQDFAPECGRMSGLPSMAVRLASLGWSSLISNVVVDCGVDGIA